MVGWDVEKAYYEGVYGESFMDFGEGGVVLFVYLEVIICWLENMGWGSILI